MSGTNNPKGAPSSMQRNFHTRIPIRSREQQDDPHYNPRRIFTDRQGMRNKFRGNIAQPEHITSGVIEGEDSLYDSIQPLVTGGAKEQQGTSLLHQLYSAGRAQDTQLGKREYLSEQNLNQKRIDLTLLRYSN